MSERTGPIPAFFFHVVSRRDDLDRPKLMTTRWQLTIEDAGERVRRGEWLLAVPSPHEASEIDAAKGRREIPLNEAMDLVERLIREGKVYGVRPTPDVY